MTAGPDSYASHNAKRCRWKEKPSSIPSAVLCYAVLRCATCESPAVPCSAPVQVGEGPQLTAVAELLEETIQRESRKMTVWEARERIFLVDSAGLVTRNRCGGGHVGSGVCALRWLG